PRFAEAMRPIGIDRSRPPDRSWTTKRGKTRRLAGKGKLLGCAQVLVQSELFGGHADGAIEAQILPVEIGVAREFEHKRAKLLGLSETLGERHRSRKPFKDSRRLVLYREHRGRCKNARHDRIDADAKIHQV